MYVALNHLSGAPFTVSQLNYSIDLQAYYLQQSMWVDNMVDKSNTSYLYQKRGVYYFSKQVPFDVRQHYKRDRIVICLKTKSVSRAKRMCESILQRLHDYWLSLRLSAMPLPAQQLVCDCNGHGQLSSGPSIIIKSVSAYSRRTVLAAWSLTLIFATKYPFGIRTT